MVIFQVTPYFIMTNIEINIFEMAWTKPMKISKRATHARNELMLLQNVSTRVWQNLVVFSSVVNLQDFFNSPVCGRRRPFQDCTERPAAAYNGLKVQCYSYRFSFPS